jgi:hypothetical protein
VAGPRPPAFRVGQIAARSLPDATQARLARNLALVVLVEEGAVLTPREEC